MGIRFGVTMAILVVLEPFMLLLEEKVAERRERQARSYADDGRSRDHSEDPIMCSNLLLATGMLKGLPADRSGGWKLNALVRDAAGARNKRVLEAGGREK
jgi:hypothetical protein